MRKKRSDIYFRGSGIGALTTWPRSTQALSPKQREKLNEYYKKPYRDLNTAQKREFTNFDNRKDIPVELSETAKSFVRDAWLWYEKGFLADFESDYTEKGIFREEEGISLLSKVHGNYYKKNTVRKYKNNKTGECDINYKKGSKRIVIDVKNSFDAKTFMNAKPGNLYQHQGNTYCDLYNAEEYWIAYLLLDCPPHILQRQKERLWRKYYSPEMSHEEAKALDDLLKPYYDQIDRNLIYTNSKRYSEEERIKIFKVERSDKMIREVDEKIPLALDYYESLTLNDVNF